MAANLSYNDIRKMLRKKKMNLPKFEILSYISKSVSLNGINPEGQELLLRVLDRKEDFMEYEDILISLIRKYGLYPYLMNFNLSLSDEVACEIHRPDGFKDVVFHSKQNEVYYTLVHKDNVVLSAPTSFGKSLIIDSIITSNLYNNIMIIVPSVALIDETRKRLIKFKEQYRVISFSGQSLGKRNIFVLTQERALDYIDSVDIDFFVIDEFYKLDMKENQEENDSREIVLNQVFYKLFKSQANYYLLGPNIERLIAPRLDEQKYKFIKTDYKTVVSEFHHIKNNPQNKEDKLLNLCEKISGQTLIYCKSPASANKVAELLYDNLELDSIEDNEEFVHWIKQNYHSDWSYPKYLEYGIGVHHGKIPRALAQKSVELFNQGNLRFLVCTSTLIEGVNTKARNVIIYDNVVNRKKMDFFSFNNICGRSGRMNSYMIGNVYTFYEQPQPELPFVNVPVFGDDSTIIPDNLLINMDDKDLGKESREQIQKYKKQDILSSNLLKKNSYIKLDYLLELSQYLYGLSTSELMGLAWSGLPDYEKLNKVCDLIWNYIVKSKKHISSVCSGKQLCYKIKQFEKSKSVSNYLKSIIDTKKTKEDNNELIESALDFMRQWLNYKFPKYLMTLQDVVNEILERRGLSLCDYSYYASYVECYFTKPYFIPFDECGLPIQVSAKIKKYISDDSIDSAIESLRKLNPMNLPLSSFEKRMILSVQKNL